MHTIKVWEVIRDKQNGNTNKTGSFEESKNAMTYFCELTFTSPDSA
jgi:hypothetical protein